MSFLLSDILAATNGRLVSGDASNGQSLKIETDSRRVAGPCVFWALPGEQFDGHDFVGNAIAQGATACVVSRSASNKTILASRRASAPGRVELATDSVLTIPARPGADALRLAKSFATARLVGLRRSLARSFTRHPTRS